MSLKEYEGFGKLTQHLHHSIVNGNISHAYIIEGDLCVDKGTFVKNFVKAILCQTKPGYGCDDCVICKKIDHDNYEDLYWIQSDGLSVKDGMVSQMQERLKTRPAAGGRNIAVIEDADTMTIRAQNRLLKTLEEPAEGTVLFLLSENTENLLPTILSRCVTYRLSGFSLSGRDLDADWIEEIAKMAMEGSCFYDLKDKLTKCVKDRKEAFFFLDGLERVFRKYLIVDTTGRFRKDRMIKNVKYVEEARRDLLANVNYKYAIRNLILKIGG